MSDQYLITRQEILRGAECPPEYEDNLLELLIKINKVRDAFGRPMTPTSGFRTLEHHLRIYKDRGITDRKKIPMKSRHLFCQAVDIADPKNILMDWCIKNENLIKEIGLWVEKDQGGWVHFQTTPFPSYRPGGTIFFNP